MKHNSIKIQVAVPNADSIFASDLDLGCSAVITEGADNKCTVSIVRKENFTAITKKLAEVTLILETPDEFSELIAVGEVKDIKLTKCLVKINLANTG